MKTKLLIFYHELWCRFHFMLMFRFGKVEANEEQYAEHLERRDELKK